MEEAGRHGVRFTCRQVCQRPFPDDVCDIGTRVKESGHHPKQADSSPQDPQLECPRCEKVPPNSSRRQSSEVGALKTATPNCANTSRQELSVWTVPQNPLAIPRNPLQERQRCAVLQELAGLVNRGHRRMEGLGPLLSVAPYGKLLMWCG